MSAVLIALVVGCASGSDAPRLAPEEPKSSPTTVRETTSTSRPRTTTSRATTTTIRSEFVVGDRIETSLGNFVQVYSYEQPVPAPDEFTTPQPGFEFAVMDVEACAGPTDDTTGFRSVNPYDFELQMPDNTRIQPDIPAREPALNDVALPKAGDCARGFVTFQVPEGVRPKLIEDTMADPGTRWTVPA